MNTIETIVRHLVQAVLPLKEAFSSNDRFQQFIYRLGWKTDKIPPSYQNLVVSVERAVTAMEALGSSPDIEDLMEAMLAVKSVYEAIKAINDSPGDISDSVAFLDEVKNNLFDILFIDYLVLFAPIVLNLFNVTGVVEEIYVDSVSDRPSFIRYRVRWERIPKFFMEPDKIPELIYGWGTVDFNFALMARHFQEILCIIGLPARLRKVEKDVAAAYVELDVEEDLGFSGPDYRLDFPFGYFNIKEIDTELGFSILEFPQSNGKRPGLIIQPNIPSELSAELKLRDELKLRVKGGSNIASTFGIVITPDGIEVRYPFSNGTTLPDFGFGMGFDYTPDTAVTVLGEGSGTRVEFRGLTFDFDFRFTDGEPEVELGFEMVGLSLVIKADDSDSFLQRLLGGSESRIGIPLGLSWSSVHGIKFKGGGGFEVSLYPHANLGPISLEELQVLLRGETTPTPALNLDLGANLKGELGPLVAVVQGIGFSLKMDFGSHGNAGPFGIDVGFKPPGGVGLSIDSGGFKGGGFLRLDHRKGEYIGALELEFQGLFSLKAIGIINTKTPDGAEGFSLLIIITAEFNPVQLGMGFTLNGVGGLFGLNRTTKIDVLRTGVKTNTLKHILFPENIVANINRIISDLKQVFPPYDGHFIIGPMAKIGWGTPSIITLEVGLLLELPDPKIAILGVLKAILPDKSAPVLALQVNFLGVIDFQNKYISFDASLYNSKLLTFTLTGDMALRISWGNPSTFILSVGGFHPAFKEAPSDLHSMERLTISLLSGDNPRITIETYFAITSNTVQVGGRVELYAEALGFNVYGFLGFDVLFQFDPFYFCASIYAGLALRHGKNVLLGVNLSGRLAGPEPWDVKGKASFKILGFKVPLEFHETWGRRAAVLPKKPVNLVDLFMKEVALDSNWESSTPAHNHLGVSIKETQNADGSVLLHPFGALMFSQKMLPLDRTLDKFGETTITGAHKVTVKEISSNGITYRIKKLDGQFAPAQFIDLKDSEKLSRKSFEDMTAGMELSSTAALNTSAPVDKDVEYEVSYLSNRRFNLIFAGVYKFASEIFSRLARGGAAAKAELSFTARRKSQSAPAEITIKSQQYALARKSDMGLVDIRYIANSQMEAFEMMRDLAEENPALASEVQVVSAYELNKEAVA